MEAATNYRAVPVAPVSPVSAYAPAPGLRSMWGSFSLRSKAVLLVLAGLALWYGYSVQAMGR